MTRKEMVRLAGIAGPRRQLLLYLRGSMDRAYEAFARQLGAYWWGPAPELPKRKVSVPRSLRRNLGRYVEVIHRGGRKRKDRRRHNRRWMPERDCECEE